MGLWLQRFERDGEEQSTSPDLGWRAGLSVNSSACRRCLPHRASYGVSSGRLPVTTLGLLPLSLAARASRWPTFQEAIFYVKSYSLLLTGTIPLRCRAQGRGGYSNHKLSKAGGRSFVQGTGFGVWKCSRDCSPIGTMDTNRSPSNLPILHK